MQQEKFEVWAIVELFGHQKMAGKVSEQTIAGSSMVRIDVPNTEKVPAFTRLLNVSAIYAINPTTEEIAVGYAERIQSQPISVYDAREVLQRIESAKQLSSPQAPSNEDEYREEDDFNG
jgi:hypothetical protein